MEFSLNKTNLAALLTAFGKDKLAKGVRKVAAHGLERIVGTLEARDGALHVKSGRVTLVVKAAVRVPGAFSIRDAVLRRLLTTFRGEPGLDVLAKPSGLMLNRSLTRFPPGDYKFPLPPQR